jgi:hypothetical protein
MRVLLALLVVVLAACATPEPAPAFQRPPLELTRYTPEAFYSALTLAEAQKARAAPLTPDDVTATHTQSLGTTAAPLFSADLDSAYRKNDVVQDLRISNRSSANTVCVWFKQLSTDCSTTCAASPKTCSGASTDGEPIAPSSFLTAPITGKLACVCGIASAASTTTTATRIVREKEK